MFQIIKNHNSISRIYDRRYSEEIDITDGTGRFGYMAYTLADEDINSQDHPGSMPFCEKHLGYEDGFINPEYGMKLDIEESDNGFVLDLRCESALIDGMGLYLPFNFISRKNGFWQQQRNNRTHYRLAGFFEYRNGYPYW